VSRAAVAFPARGSYGPASLGSLPPAHAWVRRADQLRAESGLPPLSDIDRAQGFDPVVHLRSANAAPLAFLCGLLDAERIAGDHEVVVVIASSTGWYTALAASGALEFDDAFRLVQHMALLAEEPIANDDPGAQLVYPRTDEQWREDPAHVAALASALAEQTDGHGNGTVEPDGPEVHRSLELGAFTVLSGTGAGLDRVAAALPAVQVGARRFPLRPAMHEAWHTPLRADAVRAIVHLVDGLAWTAPNVTLIDGRGARFSPYSTDPGELARQTVLEQPTTTYDFATSLRVTLREYAPDVVLLPGPGASLGEVCAQIIVAEGYRGIRSRADLETVQSGASPILLSMRR
jgi:[acyl-carrier-protein] S-malonyltransferase